MSGRPQPVRRPTPTLPARRPRLGPRVPWVWLLLLALGAAPAARPAPAKSLAGRWRFALDRADRGVAEGWYARALPAQIDLPGSLPAAGIGDEVSTNTPWTGSIVDRSWFTAPRYARYRRPGQVRVPFWLQPGKYYAGVAWFQRELEVPRQWRGQRLVLFLERVHWESRAWVDARGLGGNNSLATPHEYDLGQLSPGRHTLTIRVDNRRIVDIGENSHAISDHTQGNWNGIVGRIEVRPTPLVWLEDLQVYPHLATHSVTVRGLLGNATGRPVTNTVGCYLLDPGDMRYPGDPRARLWATNFTVVCARTTNRFAAEVPAWSSATPWDEFRPNLHELTVWVADGDERNPDQRRIRLTRRLSVGYRDAATAGTQFTINGRPTFLRGTLECCIFPKTGHPPMQAPEWKRVLGVAKAYGLNLIRFHSYCPPEAAFEAADELGLYLQVETCWANQSTTLGDGGPVDQ